MEEVKGQFIIMCRVTILENPAILNLHAFNPNIFARNFVRAIVIVANVFLGGVPRLSATQSNVHASWPYESVTQISALSVAQTKWMYQK